MKDDKKADHKEENEMKTGKTQNETIKCMVEDEKFEKYFLLFVVLLYIQFLFYSGCFDFIANWLFALLLYIGFICVGVILLYKSYKFLTSKKINVSVITSWKEERCWFLKAENLKRTILIYGALILLGIILSYCTNKPSFAIALIVALVAVSLMSYFYRPYIFVCEEGIAIGKFGGTHYLTKWSSFNSHKIFETEGSIKLKTKSWRVFVMIPPKEDFPKIKKIISERLGLR